jgi:hypothetical protein
MPLHLTMMVVVIVAALLAVSAISATHPLIDPGTH